MKRLVALTAAMLGISFAGVARAAEIEKPLTTQQTAFFESKVRPLFAAHCYKCHSAEERKAKGGLTLDTRDGWLKGGKHGQAVTPGNPSKSLLLNAVSYEDADLQMPPDGNKLKDEEIATLEQWIKMGAPDPRRATAEQAAKLTGLNDDAKAHWAFQPVRAPAIPAVKNVGWVKSPVDAFILVKLESEKMKPSTPAPREALIRRATFDLIGLPPTPEEVQQFVRDRSPNAFEKVVERLLASPHYGERWGRYWLDTARYSDTTGLEQIREDYRFPFAWTYRDYVINAFNADKPYDVFLKEQIAADLMPSSKNDPAKLAALGFITVGKRFPNVHDVIDERIDTLTKSTMALTVACARCHDHKFDPVPTADYYSLHGVFASTTEPLEQPIIGELPTGPEYEDFQKQLAQRENDSRERYYDLIAEKSAEFLAHADDYLFVAGVPQRQSSAELLKARNAVLATRTFDRDIYQQGLRRIRKNDDPVFGVLAAYARVPADEFADRAPEELPRLKKMMRRRGTINPIVQKAFDELPPQSLKSFRDVTAVYGRLFTKYESRAKEYIQACRNGKSDAPKGFDPAEVELFNVFQVEPLANLSFERMRELARNLPKGNQGGYRLLQLASIGELLLTHPGSPARAMIVADSEKPADSPIFIRGEQQNKGSFVRRQFLEILSGTKREPFRNGSGRMELAEAIATQDNPLTARVMMNRIWMHHFGQGIVRTPDDLGVQSEPPSHPELLDYLATEFVKGGWSIKAMHRAIMLSSTYQQNSETNTAYAQRDPDNRLLWRANLRRLDFEAVRDSMLMFTGNLDPSVGGKSVNLTEEPYSNRRSVYGYIDRGDLPELMSQFDFADPDMANSKRTSTIVPQQALFFMNSPMAADVARKVTSRPEFTEASDDRQRVAALYQVLFQRPPRASEVRFASEFMQSTGAVVDISKADSAPPGRKAKEMRNGGKAKKKNAGPRDAIRNAGSMVERKPLTHWEQYAQALLFANEIVYVN